MFSSIELKRTQIKKDLSEEENEYLRKLYYLYDSAAALDLGKEVRIYDLGEELLEKQEKEISDYEKFKKNIQEKMDCIIF